jgi:hypothetical protein
MRRDATLTISAVAVVTAATAIVLETTLHLAARASPTVATILFPPYYHKVEPIISDSDLVHKGNPRYPGHDANGFRNRSLPHTVEIVAIGDSHTYGTAVDFDDPWPRILETTTSCSVYNMGFPGYGPLQYAVLAEQAVPLKPRYILVGIYFGNDFYDNWQFYLTRPERYPVPGSLLRPAIERESKSTLASEIGDFFQSEQTGDNSACADAICSARRLLSQHSSLWGFGRAVKKRWFKSTSVLDLDFQIAVAALTAEQLKSSSIFNSAGWKTIFTTGHREAAENNDDPRIRVGYWLTEWAVQRIDDLAKQNGIRPIFVLLPTKESVFATRVQEPAKHKYFIKLTTDENLHRQSLIKFMEHARIDYVDMRPPLESSSVQPYFENADGHPNVIGHEIIAKRLKQQIGAPQTSSSWSESTIMCD